VTGSDLKDRISVQRLEFDAAVNAYAWANEYAAWAKAEADNRANLFSSVGIGARGVTFTMRKNSHLTLGKSFLWRGRHCFLTSIMDSTPGFVEVKAAIVEPVTCRKDAGKDPTGCVFPGVLTEKYVGHETPDLHAEVVTDYVLVTPKAVTLAPGSLVTAAERFYRVLAPHELDPWKNEYEIRRREDC
jgi:hypothetical protein